MHRIALRTDRREQFLDVTDAVADAVRELGIESGAVLLQVPHTTAAVTVNEGYDPDVAADVLSVLGRLVPRDDGYAHQEGNSDSHVKAILVGSTQLWRCAAVPRCSAAGSASSSASSTGRAAASCWSRP